MRTKPEWMMEITRDDLVMVRDIFRAFGNAQATTNSQYWDALMDACGDVATDEHKAELCHIIIRGLWSIKELEEEKNG